MGTLIGYIRDCETLCIECAGDNGWDTENDPEIGAIFSSSEYREKCDECGEYLKDTGLDVCWGCECEVWCNSYGLCGVCDILELIAERYPERHEEAMEMVTKPPHGHWEVLKRVEVFYHTLE